MIHGIWWRLLSTGSAGAPKQKSPPNANRAEEALSFDHEFAVIREQIVPALSGSVRGEIACLWEETEHMEGFPAVLRSMRQIREWNLLFDRGEIIRRKDVEALEVMPLKYPAELEAQVRQAVLAMNGEEIKKCYYRLYDFFRAEPYNPREIKECLMRFGYVYAGRIQDAV